MHEELCVASGRTLVWQSRAEHWTCDELAIRLSMLVETNANCVAYFGKRVNTIVAMRDIIEENQESCRTK